MIIGELLLQAKEIDEAHPELKRDTNFMSRLKPLGFSRKTQVHNQSMLYIQLYLFVANINKRRRGANIC